MELKAAGVEIAYKASSHSSLTCCESLVSMDLQLMKTSIVGHSLISPNCLISCGTVHRLQSSPTSASRGKADWGLQAAPPASPRPFECLRVCPTLRCIASVTGYCVLLCECIQLFLDEISGTPCKGLLVPTQVTQASNFASGDEKNSQDICLR